MNETRTEVDEIIDRNLFRQDVFDWVPAGTERILDFGCNEGELLLRLRRDKGCRGLYGIDVIERVRPFLERHLDGGWVVDLHHADLEPRFQGFFNVILMHDVVEHLYDPWYVLAKVRNLLAPGGKLVIVVPNFRYWHLWSQVILGDFRYGAPGGLMNEEHIRWFTLAGLKDLASLTNLRMLDGRWLFPQGMSDPAPKLRAPITELCIPPDEMRAPGSTGLPAFTITFSRDIGGQYLSFLAMKILAIFERDSEQAVEPRRTEVNSLEKRRQSLVV